MKMTLKEVDDLLSDLLIKKLKPDKKGHLRYSDVHETVMQIRIKIAMSDKIKRPMKTRQQAAEATALLKVKYLHDEIQDIEDLCIDCFLAGHEHTENEHREFVFAVRQYLYGSDNEESEKSYGKILHYIKGFK
jgi:hypothetical protein